MSSLRHLTLSLLLMSSVAAGGAWAAGKPSGPDLKILDRDARGTPTWVTGKLGILPKEGRAKAAASFLAGFARAHLGATGRETFVAQRVRNDEFGQFHVRAQQYLRGLKVVGAEMIVHADRATGEVTAINGRFIPDEGLPLKPLLDPEQAIAKASLDADIHFGETLDKPELVYVIGALRDRAYLAWSARVRYPADGGEQIDRVFADALTGTLVANHPQTPDATRKTYTANHGTSLPGTLLVTNTGTTSDTVAQTVHNYIGITDSYYSIRHGRNSLDNAGKTIVSTVHYGVNYNNARWNGSQIYFGDGDGAQYGPFGNGLDIVAHEFTHGVTQYESNLTYENESGAINEAISDALGASVEAYNSGMVTSANTWKLGENVATPATPGDAIRYMNDPAADGFSKDFYPDRYLPVASPSQANDYGNVHSNSGIINLAFYLIANGGSHPRGKTTYSVPGIGIDSADRIFYVADRDNLVSFAGIIAMGAATEQAAASIFGPFSNQVKTVQAAWCAVGLPGCLLTGLGGPSESCSAGPVTVSANPSTKGNCPFSSCTYSWGYRWCEDSTAPNNCPSTFQSLPDTTSSVTKNMYSFDKYLEFRVTVTCSSSCGAGGQLTGTDTFRIDGPAGPICGGGGGGPL
jgi:Zn-dependent metalloprotease